MSDDFNQERLGKIVELAKNGVGGEKETALRMVKSICKKHGLDFNSVMNDEQVREYTLDYANEREEALGVQVILRYAHRSMDDEIHYNKYRKKLFFKTTAEKYFETLNAWAVLRKVWVKEEKAMKGAMLYAFLDRHNLYYQPTAKERKRYYDRASEKKNDEEERSRKMGSSLARHLDDAQLHRSLQEKN